VTQVIGVCIVFNVPLNNNYMDCPIKEQMLSSLYEQAINTLVDRKHQLDEDFANGVINYAEYEEHKWLINNDLESLSM
jgi:hypothetical protein